MFNQLLQLSRVVLAIALAILCSGAAHAQLLKDVPDEMKDVGVDEKLGEQAPLDLEFRDSEGEWITLGDIFTGDRPVMLSLNYSNCPMLCRAQLNGLVECLREMEYSAGQEFDLVSVSIDPREQPEQAKITKEKYLAQYERTGAGRGMYFLTGREENIRALADAVGFRYNFVEERNEYAHAATLMVCSPTGKICRYLPGVLFKPSTVRLSLVEAAEGTVGSVVDHFLLTCFQYDADANNYAPIARRIMSVGAGITVAVMAACLVPFWMRRGKPVVEEAHNAT